jgi:lipoprotein-releasing system permease protein
VINLITRISVVGIAAITAALIILLSAFNGIELMIENLYSEFDTDITIRIAEGKTFNESRIDIDKISKLPSVKNTTRAVEEVVILKHESKWVNAKLVGVDSSFLEISQMQNHMVEGQPEIEKDGQEYGIIGAALLEKLDGYIPKNVGHESVICYFPKKNIRIRPGRNPFKTEVVKLSGRMNFNREVNAEFFVVPIDLAMRLKGKTDQISAIYVQAIEGVHNEDLKAELSEMIGDEFVVKTNYEKNELIYKTSKSEKIIVLIILLFIFILAAFNLVASLTMLFVEKIPDIETLRSYGATKRFTFNIFFYEGLLISFKGIFFGALLGYLVCFGQIYFEFITMPNSGGEAFPMAVSLKDGILILSLVGVLSVIFSYLPVKYLSRKNLKAD